MLLMPPVKAEVRPDTAFTSVVLDCLEGTTPVGSLRRQRPSASVVACVGFAAEPTGAHCRMKVSFTPGWQAGWLPLGAWAARLDRGAPAAQAAA